ncbi:sigma-70 family RNA polymerase sigma factor [Actinoallomurus purpureus]|uniref:sigma-70 family RNA polymerase sigma factor n=1 Tax=Actinoallomurus purpureus TaxID=478114 RepID=UPI002092A258|nr:sigma-70 family RNA polymerase sigma factor [Actinoallomurus purpureus]MCO6007041.1 sigma-70 family RNA polymerase sigma factor [Actinoallomurus purpureus]
MAGWPSIDRADDQRMARALDAGDTNALAQVYDAYGARLFDYCHVLLRDREAAAQAVHDSLITVRERIAALPDPRLFRGRLYATARAECLRRRTNAGLPAERRRAPEADAAGGIDESTRELVHAALLALSGQQREALDLAVRHELDPHELAEVLSTTPHEASVLIEQARNDLDDAFSAVVIAATGRDDCPSVPALAGPPGQPLDAERCATLARHIAGCPICGLRTSGRVATAQLLRAMPVAAAPENLRGRVLATAFSPEHARTRATIAMRFDPPPPEPRTEEEPQRKSTGVWVVAGTVVCAVLVLCGFLLVSPGSSGGKRPAGNNGVAAAPGDSPTDDGGTSSHTAGASPTAKTGSPTPTPTATPTPTPTPTPSKSSKTAAPRHHTRPGRPAPNPSTPSQQQPGRLLVKGCGMGHQVYGCQVTLIAVDGPVKWAVTGTTGGVSTGGSGTAWPNQPIYLNVSRSHEWCWGTGSGTVSFSTGHVASVTWNC